MLDTILNWIDLGLLLAVGFVLLGAVFGGIVTVLEGGWSLVQPLLPG